MKGQQPKIKKAEIQKFQQVVWDFYHANKRDLPWRKNVNPYRVLVSEIMMQQTQVSRGIVKYKEFLKAFPNFRTLASASNADVLKVWQGLGYNRRALLLKKTAEEVAKTCHGKLPDDPAKLIELPGIGPYTAGAICAFAFNKPVVFIDTNVRRVFLHYFFADKENVADKDLVPFVEAALDLQNPREWYSALMDYGSVLVAQSKENANKRSKHYARQSKFEGSLRQVRGKIVKLLVGNEQGYTQKELEHELGEAPERIQEAVRTLQKDGIICLKKGKVKFA